MTMKPIDPARELLKDGCMKPIEVAQMLGVCRREVYLMLQRGDLPYLTVGRTIRIPRRAVWDYARANMVPARR